MTRRVVQRARSAVANGDLRSTLGTSQPDEDGVDPSQIGDAFVFSSERRPDSVG